MELLKASWDGPMKVILYTKNQIAFAESVYLQQYHLGNTTPFDAFLERLNPEEMSWLRVAQEIEAAVGRENMVIRPYESIKRLGAEAYFRDFVANIGIRNPDRCGIPKAVLNDGRASNRSFSDVALKIAEQSYPLLTAQERTKMRQFLQKNFSNKTHDAAHPMSPEQRSEFRARFAAENAQLFETYMPDHMADIESYT